MEPVFLRKSVKILLLNDMQQLLLMCADDPQTTTVDGQYHGRYWFPIGGEIESSESIEEAALREIFEETGLKKDWITLGPVVWYGEFDLSLNGQLTHLHQTFVVAHTSETKFSLAHLTDSEKKVIKALSWFSLEDIKNSSDIIYPIVLPDYLPDILLGHYPHDPLWIDLAKQPQKK
ncbi:NUDIX domain-containing protein [Candidatus Nucleicultrix amoebiphila]|jgi:8-oxo-dGTP pyrophosphatase MutT (NUDIX family)|uniref:Nudix hydrolase domain-containing protein n=1 Tax=Candidatus Nucleicultrix amoebiphila FS5 TaxID=1414854 RepID=A0A1W6N4N9_9PROT|nr:NUDIX domain-containing protein [Candidatus Nucleicultrix amoebiphila]ARN84726.1 hypothetical protein GQ61_04785 [Candidatus Nucleicultrix amoebiphila FS5]